MHTYEAGPINRLFRLLTSFVTISPAAPYTHTTKRDREETCIIPYVRLSDACSYCSAAGLNGKKRGGAVRSYVHPIVLAHPIYDRAAAKRRGPKIRCGYYNNAERDREREWERTRDVIALRPMAKIPLSLY